MPEPAEFEASLDVANENLRALLAEQRQRAEEAEREAKRERAARRMAVQHAYDADAREAEADAKAALAEARYETERAAHRREAAERVRAERERDQARDAIADERRGRLAAEAAVRRVRALHQPTQGQGYDCDEDDTPGSYGDIAQVCTSCGTAHEYGVRWPCPTIAALDAEQPKETR